MKIYRLSPERYEANQRRRELERKGASGEMVFAMPKAKPSPAFKKAFAEVGDVVADYMKRGDRARAFVLRLPMPQSVNHNTKPTPSGGRVLTDEHRAFRSAVAVAVYNAKIPTLYGKLRVYIRINAPGDIDNRVKPLLDALQRAGAIDNDRNVDDLHVVRSTLIPDGMLDVEVAEI